MNTKQAIDNLLKTLCDTYHDCEIPPELDRAACAVQDALDVGAFDCLIEHPMNEPPTKDGRYLVKMRDWGWDIKYWMRSKWETHSPERLLTWRELPAMAEEIE